MSAPLVVEVVTRSEGLAALEPAWSELADVVRAGPFARPSWCRPWWAALGRGQLLVIAVRSGTDLVGLGPFHVRRRPVLKSVRFLGHGLGAVSGLLVAPGRDDAALRIWEQALAGHHVMDLTEFDERADELDVLLTGPWSVRIEPRDVCPVVRPGPDFDEFMVARGPALRRILRRAERALVARKVEFHAEVASTPEAVERLVPDVVRVTDLAEAANPRQHLLAGTLGRFTRSLLAETARAGQVRLFVARVGDQPAAYALMLRDGRETGGLAMWLNRHDPGFSDVSPGHLLLREMVRYACANAVDHIDLLIGDARYKRLWADGSYRTLDVTLAAGRTGLTIAQHQDDVMSRVRHLLPERPGA